MAFSTDTKKAAAPAKAAPKAAAPAAHSGGAAGGAHSAATGGHSTTTATHGPTTGGAATHGPTTGGAGSHTTTTTTGGASHTTTTTTGGAGHTTTGATAGAGTHTTTGAGAGAGAHGATGAGAAGASHGATGTGGAAHGATGATAGAGHGAGAGGGKVANGHTVSQTKNGGTVTRRPDGKVASLHDPKRGMDVHRGLNGNRRVVSERADHSRIYSERGGHGYVQRPYNYHGHEYARRSYYYHGAYYHRYYGRYGYRGMYVNPYYPSYYYRPAFYGWAYNPWATPIAYGWGWGGSPWVGFYGGYFTPYPVYASPALWLTDYMISTSLQAAYQARVEAQQNQAMSNPTPLTPDTKNLIAEEVRRQIALENSEAQAGSTAEPDAASSSIQRVLTDGIQHVFVAGQDIDVVDGSGAECAISQGDALQLAAQNAPDATSVNMVVLASKGGRECPRGDSVAVTLEELQDMQNHMRETIDQGMADLQKKQGQGGLPTLPASANAPPTESVMALNAPPPPPESEVASQLQDQSKEADAAEKEAAGDTGGAPASAAAATADTPTVALGQTPEQVIGALGKPKGIVDLGKKKIYVYPDMKVTFNGGKVTDIQ